MKNKKGFTIIELGISICLVTVVAFLLFQIINTVKKVYTTSDLKTTLLTKQAIMTKKIYDEFEAKLITQITSCDEWQNSCLQFIFSDNSKSILSIDPLKMVVKYNNYSINYEEIDDTIAFGELFFEKGNDFFTIKIPISSKNIKGDYGIYITTQYTNWIINSYTGNYDTINVPIYDKENSTNTTIIKEDNNYWMKVYDANDATLNNLMKPKLKKLKLEKCSVSTPEMTGNIYELKTENNTKPNHWCQSNNFYTQNVGNYTNISGSNTALGKDTYEDALKADTTLDATTLNLKVNEFINKYTFKSRTTED